VPLRRMDDGTLTLRAVQFLLHVCCECDQYGDSLEKPQAEDATVACTAPSLVSCAVPGKKLTSVPWCHHL